MTTILEKQSHPGRPLVLSHEDRRRRILEAAERIFVEAGYGEATMAAIAEASGMSKKTLYQFFPDRLSIFIALVRDCEFSFTPPDGTPKSDLREVLLGMTASALSPRRLAMTRLVIAEAHRYPELARSFYKTCMQRGHELISTRLLADFSADALRGLDVEEVTETLIGSTLVTLQMRALIDDSDPAKTADCMEKRVDAVLRLVLGTLSN